MNHIPGAATLGVAPRCLLVDDNPAFLGAAAHLLEREGVSVVGVASTSAAALAEAARLRPDVVLVDISLGAESGFDLARDLAGADPRPGVILISTHAETDLADLIEQSPSLGFVPKSDLSAAAVRRLLSEPRET